MAAIRFKPEKRVTANLGYSITSVDGSIRSSTFCSLSARYSTSISSRWPT